MTKGNNLPKRSEVKESINGRLKIYILQINYGKRSMTSLEAC